MKYLKYIFSMTGEVMTVVKLHNNKALRIDARSISLYDTKELNEEEYWRNNGYVDATEEDFSERLESTAQYLDTIIDHTRYEKAI